MTPDWQAKYEILREALFKIGYPLPREVPVPANVQEVARLALVESRSA